MSMHCVETTERHSVQLQVAESVRGNLLTQLLHEGGMISRSRQAEV
jgi:hypothetical protein